MDWIIVILGFTNLFTLFGLVYARVKYNRLTKDTTNIEEIYKFREQLNRFGQSMLHVKAVNPSDIFEWSPK